MFKFTTRIAPAATRALPRTPAAKRLIGTAPPHQKSRGWRNSAARWGLAGALVYYYNTASAFAEEPSYAAHAPPETSRDTETYPTVASISEERKAQARSQSSTHPHSATTREVADGETTAPGSPEALEEEASEQGAFNEETGEINWDCPCLGGMAYGPCGEQFRAAFSCFVFSQEEPKGVDCIEHFKTMQNCFREHPEIYGAELEDDEDGAAEAVEGESAQVPREPVSSPNPASTEGQLVPKEEVSQPPATSVQAPQTTMASKPDAPDRQKPTSNMDDYKPMPKAWHDSRDSTPAS